MANRGTAAPVVVLLLLLLAAAAARPAREKDNPAAAALKAKRDEWEKLSKPSGIFFTERSRYYTLAERMKIRATGDRKVAQHPLLYSQPRRYQQAPPFFIDETLHGEGLDRGRLFIRGDNLYLACFANAPGQVFCFNDDQYNSYKVPDSITLDFGGGYEDLVGNGQGGEAWRNLEGLDLSRPAVNRAIKVVSSYHRGKTTDAEIQELKEALATLVVFYCEAARFPYIRQLVDRAYTIGGDQIRLDFRGAQLVVQWKRISCAILIWNMDKKRWDSDEAKILRIPFPDGPGIATVEEALAEVGPILHARGCSVEDYERFL